MPVLLLLLLLLLTGCTADPSAEHSIQIISTAGPSSAETGIYSPPPVIPRTSPVILPDDEPETPPQIVLPQTDDEIDKLLADAFVYNDLIDLAGLNAGFIFDLTYATESNFLGIKLYDAPLCLAHIDLAKALLKAQAIAVEEGLCLIIYDVYRPMSVQKNMYDLTPADKKTYVAKPNSSANHPKGIAADCSLADSTGTSLSMPSGYDELSGKASVTYAGGTKEERANRDFLISVMKDAGLKVVSGEWWHYALNTSKNYKGLDISFDEFITAREKSRR